MTNNVFFNIFSMCFKNITHKFITLCLNNHSTTFDKIKKIYFKHINHTSGRVFFSILLITYFHFRNYCEVIKIGG